MLLNVKSLLIILLISSNVISLTRKITKSRANTKGVDLKGLAQVCLKSLTENIPPDFCWKKGADFGIIPTGCPNGYFRSLALCFEYCKSGYYHVLGICWANCGSGYADHGLTCFKHLFSWYFKHSYIPNSITNFSDRVPCPEGMYRAGALCYRNCNNIGLENCGIGACSASSEQCTSSIINMVTDVFQGIADAVMLVVSFGASSSAKAAKSAISTGAKKIGKKGIQSALKTAQRALTGKFKSITKDKALKAVKKFIKEKGKKILGDVVNFAVESFCSEIYDQSSEKINQQSSVSEDSLISSVDIFNVSGMIADCKSASSSEGNAIQCAKTIMTGASAIDPTGILTVAAAFMHPVCEVTTQVYKIDPQIEKAVKALDSMEDNCVDLFENGSYGGRSKKYCSDTVFLKDFNDIASSLKSGKKATGVLFEHANYQGRSLPFGPSSTIECFLDIKSEELKLNDLTSSIKFGADKCVILNSKTKKDKNNDWSTNILICENNPSLNVKIPEDLENFRVNIFREKVSAILYEGSNYSGKSWKIDERGLMDLNKIPFKNIKSAKLLSKR